jgi:Ser/Thr protein kinase RdoA (MazF antagonist)
METWRVPTDTELDAQVEELKTHARDLATRFSQFGQMPELIIHGDYYAENLIFQGDTVACVVDYDLAHWSWRSMELAEALIYFTTEPSTQLKQIVYAGFLDLDAIQRFLGTYCDTARLQESEIRALPHLIRTIWLCASLDPPLEPLLSRSAAPQALPEILMLADWARSRAEDIIEIGLASMAYDTFQPHNTTTN